MMYVNRVQAFEVNCTKYGLAQADLNSISVNGLRNHTDQGRTPPSAAYVMELQKCWKVLEKICKRY